MTSATAHYDLTYLLTCSTLLFSSLVTYLKLVEYPEAVTDIPLGDDIFKIRDENNALIEKYQQMTADEKEKK